MRVHIQIVVVGLLALLLSAASISYAKAGGGTSSINGVLATYGFRHVPMERTGTNLFVRVSINGKPAALVVDTGSPFTTLDRNSIGAFRLYEAKTPLTLSSSIGKTDDYVGVSRLKSIELANIVLAYDTATVVDLSAMNRGMPVRTAGVFGLSHMRKLGAVIDCGRRVLYLNPRGSTRQSEADLNKFLTARGYVRVPMRVNPARHPEVQCRVNGLESKITVETAAFTTILEKKIAAKAGIRLADTGFSGEGVGKRTAAISVGIAKQFSLGTFQTQNQKLSAQEATFGVLGIDYLSAHDAVIDCGGMNLFLRHGSLARDRAD